MSIDHQACKGIPIIQIDLNSKFGRKLFEDLVANNRILYAHFAPPCGTASAARSIRMTKKSHGPPPLRSLRFPMGLTQLTSLQRKKVQSANMLYEYTCYWIYKLHQQGVAWSIENPASSLMWITLPFQRLSRELRRMFTALVLDTCMFGSTRKKHTAIWTSVRQMVTLARRCDNSHKHEGWGKVGNKFATALECAYNTELATAWAFCIRQYAEEQGVVFPPEVLDDVSTSHLQMLPHYNKSTLGVQPRGNKLPPIMTDLLVGDKCFIGENRLLQTLAPGMRLPDNSSFPKGSRLLRFVNEKRGDVDNTCNLCKFAIIGRPREPEEFVQHAVKLTHPAMMPVLLDDFTTKAIDSQVNLSPVELRKLRLCWARRTTELCGQLASEEAELHNKLPHHLQRVLRAKRMRLFHELLTELQYKDDKIAVEMSEGFPLVGWLPASDVFAKQARPPSIHPDMLVSMAGSFSARAISTVKSSGDDVADLTLWEATMAEVKAGFVQGPFDKHELPATAVVSPRFGLAQKGKLRPIDNYTISGVNCAVGLQEKLKVDTMDEFAAVVKSWLQKAGGGVQLVGKTYDLQKAYRQLGVQSSHLDFSWIAVWSPVDVQA